MEPYREEPPKPAKTYTVSAYEPPSSERVGRPSVIVWYRLYSAVMALISLLVVISAVLFARMLADPALYDPQSAPLPLDQAMAFPLILIGLVMTVFHGVATFVPYKPWGWTVGVVCIGMGLTGITIVVAIPLLIHWLKPTTRAAFARM